MTTYYEKVNGEFVPVLEYNSYLMDALPEGHHLISVDGHLTVRRRDINPDFATVHAAMVIAEEEITKLLANIYRMNEGRVKLTEEENELWTQLSKALVNSEFSVVRKSPADIAREISAKVVEKAEELRKIPAVKEAWDHYLLVATLAKNNKPPQQG